MADTVRCEAGHENEAGVAFCAACGKPFPPPAPADANAVSGPTVTNEFGIEGLGPLVPMARGGQSVVYRASHPKLNRTVAVKVLTDVVDDGARARFDRECRAMGALGSEPGIVSVFDAGLTSDGSPYLLMELMEGGSLADALERQGPMRWTGVFQLGATICGALQAAHDSGVIHGDVKPENLLRSRLGETKLTDFGVSSLTTRGTTGGATLVGLTVAHAPPEVFMGEQPTPAADIYSLGSTLFTLIAGRPAFQLPGDSPGAVVQRVLNTTVPDLRVNRIPDRVCAEIEHAMARDPAARFRSAREMGEALEGVVKELGAGDATVVVGPLPPPMPIVSPPPPPAPPDPAPAPPPKRSRAVLIGGVLGLFLLAAGAIGGALLLSPGPGPDPSPTTSAGPLPNPSTSAPTTTTSTSTTTSTTSPPTTPASEPLTTIRGGDFAGTATGVPGFPTASATISLIGQLTPSDLPESVHDLQVTFIEVNDGCDLPFLFSGVSTVTGTYRFDPGSSGFPCEMADPDRAELSGTNESITVVISTPDGDVTIRADRVG